MSDRADLLQFINRTPLLLSLLYDLDLMPEQLTEDSPRWETVAIIAGHMRLALMPSQINAAPQENGSEKSHAVSVPHGSADTAPAVAAPNTEPSGELSVALAGRAKYLRQLASYSEPMARHDYQETAALLEKAATALSPAPTDRVSVPRELRAGCTWYADGFLCHHCIHNNQCQLAAPAGSDGEGR